MPTAPRVPICVFSLAVLAASLPASESPAASLREALNQGTTSLYLRYRLEYVDQERADGATEPSREAYASTGRIALGYVTRSYHDLSVKVQYEGVFGLGPERYNSGNNGRTSYPLVADHAENHELQQAYVAYAPSFAPRTNVIAGRQEIALDNQRYIGPVGWRQDWQSFDAISASSAWIDGLKCFYAYLDRVHRVLPEKAANGTVDLEGHLLNVAYKLGRVGAIVAYAYRLDFDRGTPFTNQSTATVGLRFDGAYAIDSRWSALYTLESARQRDIGDNAIDQDNGYYRADAGAAYGGVSVRIGGEILEGGGRTGDRFSTPLATLHAFNGWADLFTATPDEGLRDLFVTTDGPLPLAHLRFAAAYHDFSSDSGAIHYGIEVDALVEYAVAAFDPALKIGVKGALYAADDGEGAVMPGSAANVDMLKVWVYMQYAF